MPRFEPFSGIRYDTSRVSLDDVSAPPYDVIDADQRQALAARSPYNVVAVDCPVPDSGVDCYQEAATRFASWQADGILTTDPEASLYLYRMTFADEDGETRQTIGVLGAVGLSPPGTGDVLPHEHTTPKARSDRLQLLRATAANLSPVWTLSLATGLSKLLEPSAGDPDGACVDESGVRHELWRRHDPAAIERICATVGSAPLVIADGHHRFETCLAYRDERRAAAGGAGAAPGAYDLTLAMVVELVDDQLTVQPIHRLLAGLPSSVDLAAGLSPFFEPGDALALDTDARVVRARMADTGSVAVVGAGGIRLLRPRADAFDAAVDLDSTRLDIALEAMKPGASPEVWFQHGVENVVRAVRDGTAQAGVLVRPATVAQIARNAHSGERMPPKTTFFWPKLRTGLVFRSL